MKKILLLIGLLILLAMPIYSLKECSRTTSIKNIPCNIITSYHPTLACDQYNLSIYNASGVNILNLTFGEYTPVCNATFTLTSPQTYIWNSSIEDGVIVVEGDEEQMIIILGIFLILINLTIAYLPFKIKFGKTDASDYVVKRMVWIGAILLLWFNMTMFRQLARDWGLGVDNFLSAYWWIFTLAAFACVIIMCYVALVGGLKLMKEAQMRRRMGEDV